MHSSLVYDLGISSQRKKDVMRRAMYRTSFAQMKWSNKRGRDAGHWTGEAELAHARQPVGGPPLNLFCNLPTQPVWRPRDDRLIISIKSRRGAHSELHGQPLAGSRCSFKRAGSGGRPALAARRLTGGRRFKPQNVRLAPPGLGQLHKSALRSGDQWAAVRRSSLAAVTGVKLS